MTNELYAYTPVTTNYYYIKYFSWKIYLKDQDHTWLLPTLFTPRIISKKRI